MHRHADVPDLLAHVRVGVFRFGERRVDGLFELPVDLAAQGHHRVHFGVVHPGKGRLGGGVVMQLAAEHAVEDRRQVKRRHAVDLDPDRVVLEHRDTGHAGQPPLVEGHLPALTLIGAEHHHVLVDQLTELVALVGKLAVVGHPHHHVGQLVGAQVMAAPDVIAQVVVELFPGLSPDHLKRQAQALGQRLGDLIIDAARLAILLEAVGRKALIEHDLEHARLRNRVIAAHRRLGQHLAGTQAQYAEPEPQQQADRAHARYS